MAWAPWFGSATEIIGSPVADGVPLSRRRKYAWVVDIAATAVLAVAVLLDRFVWSLPTILIIFLAAVASIVLPRMQTEGRYAVLTEDDRLWLLTATGWTPRPEALIGPLDPEQVSGPVGPFRRTFVLAGTKHQVSMFYKKAFQQMVDTARRRPTESPRS